MAILTDDAIAQVAVNNGFPTSDSNNLAVCVAIAMAESSGRTDASNQNGDGSVDKGLWQINSVHDDLLPGQDRYDPNVNAKLMIQLSSNGSNWRPWATYTTGAYQKYLGSAISAVAGKGYKPDPNYSPLGQSSGNTEAIGLSSATNGIEKFFAGISQPDTWIRVGQIGTGGVLVLAGIIVYFRQPIMNAANKAAGIAVKAAVA